MPNLPTSIRAALGLAATAVDEARKLPETLPQMPVVVLSTAMQVSLRAQQHIAALATRGDEVLSQLRGSSAEPPAWATFDDDAGERPANGQTAAFDRVPPGDRFDSAKPDRFDTAEVAGTEKAADGGSAAKIAAARPTKASTAKASTAKAKTAKAGAAKAGTAKAGTAKASTAKASTAKTGTAKAGTAKTSAAGPTKRSEPLTEAAKKAKPSAIPNPATMAAEVLHAREASTAQGEPPEPGTPAG